MTKTDEQDGPVTQEQPEREFPSNWMEKYLFARYIWAWWPDRTRLTEFIVFLRFLVE